MSEHLPECGKLVCICKHLRACEERVRADERKQAGARVEAVGCTGHGLTVSRRKAVLAAKGLLEGSNWKGWLR